MSKYKIVIKNTETDQYLNAINVGYTSAIKPINWTFYSKRAIHFENRKEAEATITFIGSVLDWELEEHLKIIELEHEENIT